MFGVPFTKTGGCGSKTAAAGTAITELIKPIRGLIGRLTKFIYTVAGAAHTLTAMRELSRGRTSAEAAASQAVVVLPSDPGTGTAAGALAASDTIVFEKSDKDFLVATVSSVVINADGTASVTLSASLAAALPAASNFWFLGAVGDGHPQYALAASAQRTLSDDVIGVIGGIAPFSPVLLTVNNATAAGTLDMCMYGHYQDVGLSAGFAPAPDGSAAAPGDDECPDEVRCAPAQNCDGTTPHQDLTKKHAAAKPGLPRKK